MVTNVTHGVVVDLRSSAVASREANRAVRQMLVDAGAYSLLHDATIAVTEVAGSIVNRSTSPCQMTASYSADRGRLRVEVLIKASEDGSAARSDTWLDPAGLPFVGALATEHGIDSCPDGTLVWFEMLQVRVADVPV